MRDPLWTLAASAMLVGAWAGTAQAQIIYDAQPPAVQQQQAPAATPVQSAPATCAVISVRASELDPNGDIWDWTVNGDPEPDIMVTDLTSGQKQRCNDSHTCVVKFDGITSPLSLRIVDHDNVSANQLMGEGPCAIGKTCKFPNATVSLKAC